MNIDELLIPVRSDASCGTDPWASGVLAELESLAAGRQETQFSKAEEPDWLKLKARASEVARTTKDLRVGTILTSALLRTDGLTGCKVGLQLIRGYVENFWTDVYPLLDAGDNNDPSERINALAGLAVAPGADGDFLKIVQGLRKTVIFSSPRSGRFTLEHYLALRDQISWPEEAGPRPTAELLEAGKQEAGAVGINSILQTVDAAIGELTAIESIFKEKAGAMHFPSFDCLNREFRHIKNWLGGDDSVPDVTGQINNPARVETAAAEPKPSSLSKSNGIVSNRAEVVKSLQEVVAYYRRSEPSSPVPHLLERAIKIVPMNFMEVMNELAPDARERIGLLVGRDSTAAP